MWAVPTQEVSIPPLQISLRQTSPSTVRRILTNPRLKCNRSHPCENCIRRGDASSCNYAAPGTRKKNQSQGATSPDDMQNRIDRLEGLVLSLMTNGAQSAGPAAAAAAISRSQSDSAGSSSFPLDLDREDDDMIKEEEEGEDSEVDGVTNSLGVLKVDADKGKSLYFGDSHWHLVLADVSIPSGCCLSVVLLALASCQKEWVLNGASLLVGPRQVQETWLLSYEGSHSFSNTRWLLLKAA